MKRSVFVLSLAVASPVYAGIESGEVTEEVIVRASLLRQSVGEVVSPATVLSRSELENRLAATVGEVLDGIPGVANSGFGPGVGQPVIRGHGAGRVRTLQNGIDTFDAAGVSPDHAVTANTFAAESIEILRGPATLAYGSGAIGGVVNTIDELIAEDAVDALQLRAVTGADNGREGRFSALNVRTGNGAWTMALNAAISDADDIEIPGFAEASPDPGEEAEGHLDNSGVDLRSGGVGLTYHSEAGHVGIAVERLETLYGVPGGHAHGGGAPEEVRIDLEQDRYRVSGEWVAPIEGVDALRYSLVHGDYEHVELEGDEVGTRYDVQGSAIRLSADHAALGRFDGVAGVHLRRRKLEAVGDEAFVPSSETRSAAVFVVEETALSDSATLELGARIERESHDPESGSSEGFDLYNASVGLRQDVAPGWVAVGSLSHSQRAPTSEELFSNGVHVATNTFEIGSAELDREAANNVDVGLRFAGERLRAEVNAFHTRFDDFIYGASQDCNNDGIADRVEEDFDGNCASVVLDDDEPLLQRQAQAGVEYTGAELSLSYRLPLRDGSELVLGGFADHVRARFTDGGFVPRIPTDRVGMNAAIEAGWFAAGFSVTRGFAVNDTAALESESDAWNRIDAFANWRLQGDGGPWQLRLRGHNLNDEEIRQHSSFNKDDVPEIGRYFSFALQYELD